MTETLANGYSSETTERELSNEYQHDRVQKFFKNLCFLVIWTKVASALEGLTIWTLPSFPCDAGMIDFIGLQLVESIIRSSSKSCSALAECNILAERAGQADPKVNLPRWHFHLPRHSVKQW